MKKAAKIYRYIDLCYDKITMGESWWKCTVVIALLTGMASINFTLKEIGKMQRIEFVTFRHLMEAHGFVDNAALREVRTFKMITRIIQMRMINFKGIQESGNGLVQDSLDLEMEKRIHWTRRLERYLEMINIRYEQVQEWSKYKIRRELKIWDTEVWEKIEMSTL